MKSEEQEPKVAPPDKPAEPKGSAEAEVTPTNKQLDPKEVARQRSKDDLARKRHDLHGSHGKR